jgi:hypothetical protein
MDLATLQKSVNDTHESVKSLIAKRDEEIKTLGAATEATGKKLEEQGKLLNETKTALELQLKDTFEKVEGELKNAGVRIDEVEKKLGRGKAGGMLAQDALEAGARGIAKAFVSSPEYKAKLASNSRTTSPVKIKSFFPGASESAIKALLTSVADGFIQPLRIQPLEMVRRQLRVRDLFNVRPTTNPSIEYIEMTGMAAAAGAVAVSGNMTQSAGVATVNTTADHGLKDGDLVRIAGATQTEYNGDQYVTVVDANTFTFSVDSGATSPATTSTTITWLNLSNQAGGAAAVAEAGTKPESLLSYVRRTALAKKIATWIPASDEIVNDETMMQAQIEDQLLAALAYKEEVDLLYGPGTGSSLQGIMTHPRVQSYDWSDGETLPVPDTKLDAFRRGITKAQVREYVPTGAVINPQDWEDFELAKGADGHYIWLNVQSGNGLRAFQLPLVVTNAIEAGESLVGSFATAAQIWDREEATIEIAREHASYFIENMVAIRAEERLIFPIFRPDAFVIVNFDAEPS